MSKEEAQSTNTEPSSTESSEPDDTYLVDNDQMTQMELIDALGAPVLNTQELAERWGCTNKDVLAMQKRGELPKYIRVGRRYVWLEADIAKSSVDKAMRFDEGIELIRELVECINMTEPRTQDEDIIEKSIEKAKVFLGEKE